MFAGLKYTAPKDTFTEYGTNLLSSLGIGALTYQTFNGADGQVLYRISSSKIEWKSLTGSQLTDKTHYVTFTWAIY